MQESGLRLMYVKLFASELDSSIMELPATDRLIWHYLLMLADQDGVIDMTPESISRRVNMPVNTVNNAILLFQEPDPRSRSQAEEGRRLVKIRETFGWLVVNYIYYRDLEKAADRREYQRIYHAEYRRKQSVNKSKQASTKVNRVNPSDAEAEAYAEATAEDIFVEPKGPTAPPSASDQVFSHWQAAGHQKAIFSPKRKRAVQARLKEGYTPEQLCRAVDGCMITPHNQGVNDRGEKYDDLELICRDAEHVDRFIRNAENPPKPVDGNGYHNPRQGLDGCDAGHPKADQGLLDEIQAQFDESERKAIEEENAR